jgi:hypothetical protein
MDPKKLVFARVAWMERYQGDDNDTPLGGGAFVEENGTGHEIYNFMPTILNGDTVERYYGCFYLENYKDLTLLWQIKNHTNLFAK